MRGVSPHSGRSLLGQPWAVVLGLLAVTATALSAAPGRAGAAVALSGAASSGSVTGFAGARPYGSPDPVGLAAPTVAVASTPDGRGYWLLGGDGGVFSYGDAGFYGSAGGSSVAAPFVGMAPTPDGRGYWLATDTGMVRSFGDAPDEGYLGVEVEAPVAGIASTADGGGYWLVGADGGVFSLGDAHFYGSTGATPLAAPIVGMAATPDGHGYWLVGADGGVFSFGDAHFYGSLGAAPPGATTPVTAMAAVPDGSGYWLATTDRAIPAPTAVPSVLADCNIPGTAPAVQPATVMLACGDGNAYLEKLTWSSWTATTAAGAGLYTHNTCTPTCAQGSFVSTPATVRLSYPIGTAAGREFATISYTYLDPTAAGGSTTSTSVAPTSPG